MLIRRSRAAELHLGALQLVITLGGGVVAADWSRVKPEAAPSVLHGYSEDQF